jgi:hypothetical protein
MIAFAVNPGLARLALGAVLTRVIYRRSSPVERQNAAPASSPRDIRHVLAGQELGRYKLLPMSPGRTKLRLAEGVAATTAFL